MGAPKFVVGAIVRSPFFSQLFPDGHEAQNRFKVDGIIDRPKKGRMYLVEMISKPYAVREIPEDKLEPAR